MSVSRWWSSEECGTRKFLGGSIGWESEVNCREDLGDRQLYNYFRYLNSAMGNNAEATVRMQSRTLRVSVRRRQYRAEQNEPNTQNAEE
jgi:hypothetical protein